MAKPDTNGRERVEIRLKTETRKKAEAKAKKVRPEPVSAKKFIEDIVENHLNSAK